MHYKNKLSSMNPYLVPILFLFEFNYYVQSKVTSGPLNHTTQVPKCISMCFFYENIVNYTPSTYLLQNDARQYFVRNLYNKVNKNSSFLTTNSSKILITKRSKFDTKGIIVRDVTNTNTEKTSIIPSKNIVFYYNATAQFAFEKNASYSNKNVILREDKLSDSIENMTQTEWNKYTPDIKENEITKDSDYIFERFKKSLELFERKFYKIVETKLRSTSPENRKENGISFVQSGLLLYMALLAISTEVDLVTKKEIDSLLMFPSSILEEIKVLKHIAAWLPVTANHLKFRWASRLVLEEGLQTSQLFVDVANTTKLIVRQFSGTDTGDNVLDKLNHMVEIDSGGAMRDTFIEDDFLEGFCSVLITTMYIRGRWRIAPTVLNGTYPFKDGSHQKLVNMIKLNDIMGYGDLKECDAEAIEIDYDTPGLKLLMLVPRGNYLKNLSTYMETTTPQEISSKLRTIRVSAVLPIYTLRMTLLLPEKLKLMNISRLVDAKPSPDNKCGELRLSQAVQRLMFWAEAGRNAFKDDGIEWDEKPDLELVADRPYMFYVRWKNVTLMNGVFVL